jgi:hypothetical protein
MFLVGARTALLALGAGALVQQAQAARADDAVDTAVNSVTEVVKVSNRLLHCVYVPVWHCMSCQLGWRTAASLCTCSTVQFEQGHGTVMQCTYSANIKLIFWRQVLP